MDISLSDSPPLSLETIKSPSLAPRRTIAIQNGDSVNTCNLSILAWNIHGELDLMLRSPSDLKLLQEFDIILLQETWLLPDQDTTLPIPDGYSFISFPHPDPEISGMRRPSGGLAVMYRSAIEVVVCKELSSSESLVLDLDDLTIILSYLTPRNSKWSDVMEEDPGDILEGVLAVRGLLDKPILLLGDENCRTGSLSSYEGVARVSMDSVVDVRGKWFRDLCEEYHLVILNGTKFDEDVPGTWSSFQHNGEAVVDYACASESLLPCLRRFCVVDRPTCSDHAYLSVVVDSSSSHSSTKFRPTQQLRLSRKQRTSMAFKGLPKDPLPLTTDSPMLSRELDELYAGLVSSVASPQEALRELYGNVTSTGD